MAAYVYIQSEPQLWSVGFWRDMGAGEPSKFEAESDHTDPDDAAERVRWLNGGNGEGEELELFACPVGVTSNGCTPLVVCDDGSVWVSTGRSQEWEELLPIPGTERAHEIERGELEQAELGPPDPDQFDLDRERGDEWEELERQEGGYEGGEI